MIPTHMHRVWALNWEPLKTRLGVQTLCVSLLLSCTPAQAQTGSQAQPPDVNDACAHVSELTAIVQRQAADTAMVRYLLAEVMRALDELKGDAVSANSSQPVSKKPVPLEDR